MSTNIRNVAVPAISRRVLVVDDNRDAADTMAAMLRLLGHQSRALYDPNGVEAEVDDFGAEVVFLDVGMPGRSGYEVARALREGQHRSLIICALTGWGNRRIASARHWPGSTITW